MRFCRNKIEITQSCLLVFFILLIFLLSGCGVEAAKEDNLELGRDNQTAGKNDQDNNYSETRTKIEIEPDSPADTVKVFYKNLRERKFREALFLTNLRPAIENLTESEVKDLQVDFAALANLIPPDVAINGEIISGNSATVTAKLPDNETGKTDLQEIRLRRENDVWIILTVDEASEARIKAEGKNYFFSLKIETHQKEAKEMLNRILKAQMVYIVQNKGFYADISTLIAKDLLPADIKSADSTGYNYQIKLTPDKKGYSAEAVPAVYGKTGKMTFWFQVGGDTASPLKSADNQGKSVM